MTDLIASYLSDQPRVVGRRTMPSERTRFIETVATANRYQEAGAISTAAYKDCKAFIDHALELAFSAQRHQHIGGRWDGLPEGVQAFIDIVYFPTLHTIPAIHRKAVRLAVDHPYATEALALLCDALPLVELFGELKALAAQDLTAKRAAREAKAAEPKPSGYVPPTVSNAYQAMVVTLLEGVTDAAYERLRNLIHADILAKLQHFLDQDQSSAKFFSLIGKLVRLEPGGAYVRVADHDAAALKLATEMADEYRTFFVHKNYHKIASIIEGKRGYKSAVSLGHTVDLAGLSGNFHFDFEDGSKFSVVNQCVAVVNHSGTRFFRFPLTFHEVVLPDGLRMKIASQARMNEIFAQRNP